MARQDWKDLEGIAHRAEVAISQLVAQIETVRVESDFRLVRPKALRTLETAQTVAGDVLEVTKMVLTGGRGYRDQ